MKHLIKKISIAGLILMLAFACKSGNNGNSEKYTFEYNLPQGEIFKQVVSMESKTTQEFMGQKMKSDINMNMSSLYHINDVNDDNYIVTMTMDAIRMDMSVMGMTVSYDSDTDEEKAYGQNLSPVFKAMTNIPVEVEINRNGEMKSAKGFEKILDAMNEAASELDEETKELFFKEIHKQFSDKAIKESFEQSTMYLPKKPVAIGEKWNMEVKTVASYAFDIRMELQLISVNDNVAIIEGTGKVSTSSGGMEQEVNGIETKINLSGTQTATIEIDTQTGWVINAIIEQDMKGKIEAMGMEIPQNTVNIIKITN